MDFIVSGPQGVLAVEARFTEKGLGSCSCAGRDEGRCDERILEHRPYWAVARSALGLEGPDQPRPCELSLAYQAVRNAAAAIELSGLRAVRGFALLYDERNPYFAGAGDWPGWAAVLTKAALEQDEVLVRTLSRQQLIPLLPTRGRREVLRWTDEKHGLMPSARHVPYYATAVDAASDLSALDRRFFGIALDPSGEPVLTPVRTTVEAAVRDVWELPAPSGERGWSIFGIDHDDDEIKVSRVEDTPVTDEVEAAARRMAAGEGTAEDERLFLGDEPVEPEDD